MRIMYKAIYDNHYEAVSYAECMLSVGYANGYEISIHKAGYKICFTN